MDFLPKDNSGVIFNVDEYQLIEGGIPRLSSKGNFVKLADNKKNNKELVNLFMDKLADLIAQNHDLNQDLTLEEVIINSNQQEKLVTIDDYEEVIIKEDKVNIPIPNINASQKLSAIHVLGIQSQARATATKADLSYGYDLSGIDLSSSDLRSAQIRNCNLNNVNFQDAFLQGIDLRGSSMEGANFTGAILDFSMLPRYFKEQAIIDETTSLREVLYE